MLHLHRLLFNKPSKERSPIYWFSMNKHIYLNLQLQQAQAAFVCSNHSENTTTNTPALACLHKTDLGQRENVPCTQALKHCAKSPPKEAELCPQSILQGLMYV